MIRLNLLSSGNSLPEAKDRFAATYSRGKRLTLGKPAPPTLLKGRNGLSNCAGETKILENL